MTSIGRRYTGGNVLSRAILITQPLSANKYLPPSDRKARERRENKQKHENARPKATRLLWESRKAHPGNLKQNISEPTPFCSLLPPPSFLTYTVKND